MWWKAKPTVTKHDEIKKLVELEIGRYEIVWTVEDNKRDGEPDHFIGTITPIETDLEMDDCAEGFIMVNEVCDKGCWGGVIVVNRKVIVRPEILYGGGDWTFSIRVNLGS